MRATAGTSRIDAVDAWVRALERADDTALIELLAPDPLFVSPFSRWATHRDVSRACRARVRAFTGWRAVHVIADRDATACVVWQAEVGTDRDAVSGVELLTTSRDQISRVDVYLRPAAVLPLVYEAMQRHWR